MLPGIAPVHPPQHAVRTALHRQVDVVADLLTLRNQVDELSGAVLWMRGHKADAKISVQRLDAAQKLGKVDRFYQALAIGVDILPQQQDLLVAHRQNLSGLLQDSVRLAADLPAADIRNNTVGAEVVTAVHDLQRRLHTARTADGQMLGNRIGSSFPLKAVNHSALTAQQAVEQFWQAVQHMGAKDQLHKGITAADLPDDLFLLHHAAAQTDNDVWICLFEALELPDHAQQSHLRIFTDGASVVEDNIGLLFIKYRLTAHIDQHSHDLFAVGHIALTTECFDERAGRVPHPVHQKLTVLSCHLPLAHHLFP